MAVSKNNIGIPLGFTIKLIAILLLGLGLSPHLLIPGVKNSVTVQAAEAAKNTLTATPLTLVGTITSENGETLALLQAPNASLNFYKVGDSVHGYILQKITHNSILLRRNDQLYTLFLQEKNFSNTESAKTPQASSHTEITINRNLLNHIRKNFQSWFNAVSIRQEMTDGYISGYLIESIGKTPYDANIGLQEGDIIKAVNGISISQPLLFAKTMNNLMDVSDIRLEIERESKLHILNFNIKE